MSNSSHCYEFVMICGLTFFVAQTAGLCLWKHTHSGVAQHLQIMLCMKIDREEEFIDEATTSVCGINEAIERSLATGDHFHIQQILRYKSINLSKY